MAIRETLESEVETLVGFASATGVFKPVEIDMLQEVFDDYFSGDVDPADRCVTLADGREPLGFAYFGPAEMTVATWEMWWIVVRPDMQRRGLGKQLMEYVERESRAAGGKLLYIDTSSLPAYEPTRLFYLRNGYEQEAVLRDFYADGDSKVLFRKQLC